MKKEKNHYLENLKEKTAQLEAGLISLQESEKRFRSMADNAPVMIWVSGIDKLCTWFNRRWLEFVGRSMEMELGNGWAENIHPDDFNYCLNSYVNNFDERKPFSMEYRLKRYDGKWRWILDNGTPSYETNGEFVGYIGSCIDITESKKTDEEFEKQHGHLEELVKERTEQLENVLKTLKETEERTHLVVDTAYDGYVGMDMNGFVTDWNRQAEIIFGFPRKEIIGKALAETIIPHRYRDKHKEGLQRFFKTGEGTVLNKRLELSALHSDGHEFPIEITIAPLKVGEKYFFSAFIRDITETKHMEELDRKAKQRIEGLLNFTPDAIVAVDKNGTIIFVNHQTEKLFGYKQNELINLQLELLLPDQLKSIHEKHRTSYFHSPRVREMGAGLELYGRKKNGSEFPVQISLSPFEFDDETVVISAIRDITDRKLAEEEIRKQRQDIRDFIDSMSTMSAKVTKDGTILMANKIAQQGTGLSMEELLKTNFLEGEWWTFDPEVLIRVKEAFSKACTGIPINYDEKIFVFNQVLTINFSLIPIYNTNNEIDCIIAEGRDITQIKLTEEALQQRTTQLETVNKELESFSYTVSHDLRAPIRHISGFLDILHHNINGMLDEKNLRYFKLIKESANEMGSLIDDLLNFSRTAKADLTKTRLNLNNLVKEIIEQTKRNTAERNIEWIVDDLPYVNADSFLLRMVFINLISNAIKFTAKKEKTVITIGYENLERDHIVFVKDNGIGFEMTYYDKLFGVFQRLHSDEDFPGTGIGLATVKKIIIKHGGKVWAQSKEGEGATFFLSLPKEDF